MGCCSTRAQVCHAAPVALPVDFDGGEHLYRVHPINLQLKEHGCDTGQKVFDKHEPRDILHCHVERRDQSFDVVERAEQWDQEYELSATMMTNSNPEHNNSASKMGGLIHIGP